MVDENVEHVDFPQSWDDLKAYDDGLLADVPDMVQAEDFSPAQTAMFTVTSTRLDARLDALRKLGFFNGRRPKGKPDDEVNDGVAVQLAEFVGYADTWFESIAVDVDAYHAWVKGRDVVSLFVIFTTLERFYGEQLGKSSGSKKRSKTAE